VSDASAPRAHGARESGERLRQLRLDRGLRRLEISPATVSAVENGRRRLSLTRLGQAAEILDARIEDLRTGERSEEEPPAGSAGVPQTPPGGAPADAVTGPPSNWRIFAPLELNPPLTAALTAFLEFGYHGATMRAIAQRAGLSVPGVYHYYASKQEMLVAILDITMADLLARTTAARAEGRDPVERFALIVECLALYHTHRRELGFVGASEMRSLVPRERARVAAARRAQQRMVDDEVERACRDGDFAVPRPHEASRAVVTMCTALPQWFDGRGPATAEEVAAQYVEFALDLMRYPQEGSRRNSAGTGHAAP
jgi:AcrR family transcriptional regulator/transcriptional regulator with XRE-family HTH domain